MKAAAIKRLALDASVALAWCFAEERTAFTETVLDELTTGAEALVPSIWPFEVANALLIAERHNRITASQTAAFLQRISNLPFVVDPIRIDRAFGPILLTGKNYKLTEYDAAYLELALREGVPLATLDERLQQAARTAGVAMVEI